MTMRNPREEADNEAFVDLAEARNRLTERRERFVHLRQQQNDERAGLMGDQPLDGGDHAQREIAVDLLDQLDAGEFRELQAIDAALARIESGDYGECMDCGEPISAQRLEVLPEATLCITCAEIEAAANGGGRREPRSTTL